MKTHLLKYSFLLLFFCISLQQKVFGQTVQFSALTGGLASSSLTMSNSRPALIGFQAQVTGGSITFKQFNINSSYTTQSVFANGTLFRSASSTFNIATPGVPVGNVTFSGNNITVDNFSETVSSTPVYYFLVADLIGTGTGQVYINTATFATDNSGSTNYPFYNSSASSNNTNTYFNYTITGGTAYNLRISNLTGGLASTATTLTPGTSNVALYGFSITTTANFAFSSIKINSNLSNLSAYFTSFILYRSNSATYPGTLTNVSGTITAANSSYVTVSPTALTENVNSTTQYYFLVGTTAASFTTLPASIQFNIQSGQTSAAFSTTVFPSTGSFNQFTAFGNTYNFNSANLTATNLTGGVQTGTITAGQSNVVLFGFNLAATSPITVTGFNINSTNTAASYFGNGKLYRNATTTYPSTPVQVGSVTFNGNYAVVTGLTETINTTAKNYFLVADNIGAVASQTIAFNFTSGQSSVAVTQSSPTASTYNTLGVTGATLNLPSPSVVITGLNSASINNITTSITPNSTAQAFFGFKLQAYGPNTIDAVAVQFTSGDENTYFTNGTIVSSTDDVYSADDVAVGTVSFGQASLAVATFTSSIVMANGAVTRFFIVGDTRLYNTSGTVATSNYQFTTSATTKAINPYGSSPYNPTSNVVGATLNFPGSSAFIWTGGANNTDASNSSNWSNFSVPSTTSNVYIPGGLTYYPALTGASAIGSITFSGTGGSINLAGYSFSPATNITVASGGTASILGGGTITPGNGGDIIVNNGGTLNLTSATTLANSTTSLLTNNGTINLTGTGAISVPNATGSTSSTNTGTINLNGSGTLTFGGGFTNAGTISKNSASNITLTATSWTNGSGDFITNAGSGNLTISGGITNTGTINKNSTGTLTISNALTNGAGGVISQDGASGLLSLANTVSNTGDINLTAAGPLTIAGALTNNSGGDVTQSGSGTLTLTAAPTLSSGSTITQSGGGIFTFSSATALTNSGTITQSGTGTMTFGGAITNSGTFTTLGGTGIINFPAAVTNSASSTMTLGAGTGTVNLTATGAQAIANNSTIPVTFNNLNIATGTSGSPKQLSGTGTFNIVSTGKLTIVPTGTNILNVGTNLLTLRSGAAGSASVGIITAGQIVGALNVERYITGGTLKYRGYRLVSSPTNQNSKMDGTGTINLADLNNTTNINTQGAYTGGPGTGFNANGQTTPSVYIYDERFVPVAGNFNAGKFKGITTINATPPSTFSVAGGANYTATLTNQSLPVGNGYLFYNIGPVSQAGTASGTIPLAYTITHKGYLNQGNVPVTLWYTGPPVSGKLSYTNSTYGYNLVGNPYAATINLDQVFTDNPGILTYVQLLSNDNTGGQNYAVYDKTGATSSPNTNKYIASGQGFFVRVTSANQTLIFKEGEKDLSNNPQILLLSTKPVAQQKLTGFFVKMEQDSTVYDYCGVYFSNNNIDTYDVEEDVIDLDGNSPQVYMSTYTSDNRRTSLNHMSAYKNGTIIKLYVNAVNDGTYKLKVEQIKNIDPLYDVWLIDNLKSDSVNLSSNLEYKFNITRSDATTYGADRFKIVIRRKPLPVYQFLTLTGTVAGQAIYLNWKTANEADYTGFTVEKLNTNKQYDPLTNIQSTGVGSYTFTDRTPNKGVNTYRIKQDDIDGKITYSTDLNILDANDVKSKNFTIYPNPIATTTLNVKFINVLKESVNIMVSSASGNVMSTAVFTQQEGTIDVSKLKTGIYFIKVTTSVTGQEIGAQQFIKL